MRASTHRGLTLVELMVGLALGLLIVAIATSLLVSRIREHRAMLLEARLMQDLRTAADLVARDLRRAGYWGEANAAVARHGLGALQANPYTAMSPSSGASDAVSFRYSRDNTENHNLDSNEQFGFRLRAGVVEMLLGSGSWQALTDSGTLVVTAFSVTPTVQEISLLDFCAKECLPAGAACGPKQQVRSLALAVTGHAATDVDMVRTLRSQVRLRNDAVVGACPV
jgi:type IV pilus assembly protein PilW